MLELEEALETPVGEPIPGHPDTRYRLTDDARIFGPRGELTPFLARGYPAITTPQVRDSDGCRVPKKTHYLALAAARAYLGEPAAGEKLVYIDGNLENWRRDNLVYVGDQIKYVPGECPHFCRCPYYVHREARPDVEGEPLTHGYGSWRGDYTELALELEMCRIIRERQQLWSDRLTPRWYGKGQNLAGVRLA